MKLISKSLIKALACTVVAIGAVSLAQAQTKVDPSGTWTWSGGGRAGGAGGAGGGARAGGGGTNILVLKYEAGKLTGTLQGPARGGRRGQPAADATTPPPAPTPAPKVEIKDGKVVADAISFTVTTTRGGNDVTTTYKGKVADDKITGTRQQGENDPVDWVATKQK